MPIFTLFFLILNGQAASLEGSPLIFAMGANGPLSFKSLAACEVERAEVSKRNYPNAKCVEVQVTKGNP